MCRKPIGHGLFLRCLLGDAGGDACVGIGLDFLLRMTGFVIPGGMQWSVGIFPLFSQCDPAGRRPVKTGDQQIIIVARSAPQIPHCTGGGIRSDGGSSARSGRENDGQQASAEAACGLCRAATVEAVQSFASQQRSLLCPLSENLRPIPTEVPCGHFWRHLLVTKGGKSAPRRKRRIEGRDASRRIDRKIFLLSKFFFCAFGSSTAKSSGCRHLRSLSDHERLRFSHDRSGRSRRCRHCFRYFRSAIPQAGGLPCADANK